MAVENEIMEKKETDGTILQEIVAVEVEFEKENIMDMNASCVKDNDSCEIQLEEGVEGEDIPDSITTQKQTNSYAAKKTVAQGMMDIALITANANQLRYIIEYNSHSSTYYLNLILIIISLFLQIGVGICLIFKGRMDLRGESKHRTAKKMNNYVVVGIFLVTIINVFIASFTITGNK